MEAPPFSDFLVRTCTGLGLLQALINTHWDTGFSPSSLSVLEVAKGMMEEERWTKPVRTFLWPLFLRKALMTLSPPEVTMALPLATQDLPSQSPYLN